MSPHTIDRCSRARETPYVASASAAWSARHAFRLAVAPRISTSQIETAVVILSACLRA
jgi:hypothetical protein